MSRLEHGRIDSDLWHGAIATRRSLHWTVEFLQGTTLFGDLVLVIVSAIAAFAVRNGNLFEDFQSSGQLGLVTAIFFVLFMALRGGYSLAHLSDVRRQLVLVTQGWILAFFALAWIALDRKSVV